MKQTPMTGFERVALFVAALLICSTAFIGDVEAAEKIWGPPYLGCSQGDNKPALTGCDDNTYTTASGWAQACSDRAAQMSLNDPARTMDPENWVDFTVRIDAVTALDGQPGSYCYIVSGYYGSVDYELSWAASEILQCPDGQAPDPVTGECKAEPQTCTAEGGYPAIIGPVSGAGGIPAKMCFQGCQYTATGLRVEVGEPPEAYSTMGSLVPGQSCTGEEVPADPGENCGQVNGVQYCIDEPPGCGTVNGVYTCQEMPNCGTVNGEYICFDNVPEDDCSVLADGAYICDADATDQPTTPDGTAPAEPEATITDTSGRPLNYYGPQTVTDSGTPTFGDSETPVGEEGSGESGVGAEDIVDAIEGDGTETLDGQSSEDIAGWMNSTGVDERETALGEEEIVPTLDSGFLPTIPESSGVCQNIQMNVLGLYPLTIPGDGCTYFIQFRELFAWFLYMLTIVYVWSIVMGSGNSSSLKG